MLIDTNVISEASKARPHSGVTSFFRMHSVSTLYISTVSLAELQYGAESVRSFARAEELRKWIRLDVRPMFGNRVQEITETIILRWIYLALARQGKKANKTFAQPDLFLAATALEHDLTLVTRNTKDFAGVPGLRLFNPWEPTE